MKKIVILLAISTLFACNQTTTTSKTESLTQDKRPETQIKFIKVLDDIYDNCLEQNNEITLKEAADSGKVRLTRFITDTLKSEFKNWKAKVYDIERDELDGSMTISFMMSKRSQFNEDHPELNAIFFKQRFFDNTTKDIIKRFKKDDEVLLDGVFSSDKDEYGNIEFSSYMDSFKEGDAFDNPIFDIVLVDVVKSQK